MRGLFGLVSLLVVVAIIVWAMSDYTQVVSSKKASTEEQVSQIAGRDLATGGPASESAKLDLVTNSSGKPDSILITSIVPTGAYAQFYGLKRNDSILQMGELSVRDNVQSVEDATAFLMDAYQRQKPLVVVRDGNKITLPQAQPQPAPQPAPAAGKSGSNDPLDTQLDSIGARRGL
jgi:hypothetical protein